VSPERPNQRVSLIFPIELSYKMRRAAQQVESWHAPRTQGAPPRAFRRHCCASLRS